MRKPFTPQQKQRIPRRHRGTAYLLAVVAVLIQPLTLNWQLLTSMNSILMTMVMMLFLTRNSALRAHRSRQASMRSPIP
jgi:hypothetical protein